MAHQPAHSHQRLQHLVALRECGNKLWGFSKSSLLEFLVASHVKRVVLEEGKRGQTVIDGSGRSDTEQHQEMEEEGEEAIEQLVGMTKGNSMLGGGREGVRLYISA